MSCTKQPYYEIPTDASGKAVITAVSTTTTTGVTALDDKFTVNSTLPNAKSGDVMTAELLKLQIPSWGGTAMQNLPLAGTKKTVTVSSDLKSSVTYTRAEAQMVNIGDYVTFTLSGATESGYISTITLATAMAVASPKSVGGKAVSIIRTPEVANIQVSVTPKLAAYAGSLTVKRKNSVKASWETVSGTSSTNPFQVPIAGSDFAAGKDTMYYQFTATVGSLSEVATTKIIVSDPFFFLKKSATIALGGSSAGRNLFINAAVAATNANAIIAVDAGSLVIHGGSAWAVGDKSISFVQGTKALYDGNSVNAAMTSFAAGTATATADPNNPYYIFKIVNGANPSDVYYGMIQIITVVPGVSVAFEYRIGNQYAHLSVIQ
ncbi:MAG: hypothetical protein Q8N05_19090 [Bacteroidota bacterium]|nr:hypothetical protein [Bacteroidota bacterium]